MRVVEELGRTVDALGRFDDVGAQHFAPLGLPDPNHHEVRDREDKPQVLLLAVGVERDDGRVGRVAHRREFVFTILSP